ncbi:hypothetical protein JCGZ_26617 [Jatropha curcas]|uniref:Uncharacterized protein n=1 Tax=Jatropha curcas TaxID=180498 RepID=A0A067JJX9_JATCU|nr:hypothetical protein JCGZ_26617 [Jatropha curcas]
MSGLVVAVSRTGCSSGLWSPSGDSSVESRRVPRYLAHCHHTYASSEDPEYWWSFLNDRELSDLFLTPWDCEAWRTYPGREVAELHTRSRLLMQGYWADRYFLRERVFDTPMAPAQRRVPHAPPPAHVPPGGLDPGGLGGGVQRFLGERFSVRR